MRIAQGQAHAAHAQCRIRLVLEDQAGAVGLVGAQVQGADGHRQATHAKDKVAVGKELLLLAGRVTALQEEEFGAEQTDAGGTEGSRAGDVGGHFRIRMQVDLDAVEGACFGIAQARAALVLLRDIALPLPIAGQILRGGVGDDIAAVAIDQDEIAITQVRQRLVRADHHRQAQRARQDGAVRQRAAAGKDEAEHAMFGKRHEFGRGHRVADQDLADARGELAFLDAGFAAQGTLHATDDMLDVLAPAAQVGIIHGLEHGNQAVALHLQRRTGAEAAILDQVVQAIDEFGISENQAVRIDELGDFAGERAAELVAQDLQFGARQRQRIVDARQLGGDIGLRERRVVDEEAARLFEASASERHAARCSAAFEYQSHAGSFSLKCTVLTPWIPRLPVLPGDYWPSSNLRSNRSTRAFIADSSSGPSARKVSTAPSPAASIITPMMLLALTSLPR